MKNQLTTIASMPSGAGQAAHLPAEVGEAEPTWNGVANFGKAPDVVTHFKACHWDVARECFVPAAPAAPREFTRVHLDPATGRALWKEKCRANFQHLDATPPTPADKQGLEPPEYAERS
jgi:hypothetical protein